MITTVNQKKLKEGLSVTEKIVSRNASLPVLQNIVLKTENGRLKLSSTNLEIGINFWLSAKITEDGEIAVPARTFSDFINNIQDEKVSISTKDNVLSVNTDNYKTKIIGFSAKDFPIIPKAKEKASIIISAGDLTQILTAIVDSASVSETRPELASIFMNFSGQVIEGAATDSFRLAERILSRKNEIEQSVIIPRTTVQELIRVFNGLEDNISITISENQIFFLTSDIEVISRLIDGVYPDYKKVIPERYVSRILVKKNELERSVRLASIFSSSIADIKIKGEGNSLKIMSNSSDKGEINSSIEATLKNEPFLVSVNYRYLLDGLKIMPTENVILEFTGESNPLVIRPEDKSELTYLIMPLRS